MIKKRDSKKAEPGRKVCYLGITTKKEIWEEANKWPVSCITDGCIVRADVEKHWERKGKSFHSFHLLWIAKSHRDF